MKNTLYIVIPCYNEEDVLPHTAPLFQHVLEDMIHDGMVNEKSRILFVNDGSNDETWTIIKSLSKQDDHIVGISQSRNRGHQNALAAGIFAASEYADCIITADADGQDDIATMKEMVKKYLEGYQVVYGVRSSRGNDKFFKKHTAEGFYKLMGKLGVRIIPDHADYRLISSDVITAFKSYKEVNLFLRGLFPLIGFKSTKVYYERKDRIAGETHYSLPKMLRLAENGITGMSLAPLRLIFRSGMLILMTGLVFCIALIIMFLSRAYIPSTLVVITFIILACGVQTSSLGIVGCYVGKAYMESKHRPRFIISETTSNFVLKDGDRIG